MGFLEWLVCDVLKIPESSMLAEAKEPETVRPLAQQLAERVRPIAPMWTEVTTTIRPETPRPVERTRSEVARVVPTVVRRAAEHERVARIRAEVLMIAPQFSRHEGVEYDMRNCDWVMVPKYPLPERWARRWCKLLIIFPETYPVSPPIGFYLNRKFKLKDGSRDSHLIGFGHHDAPDLEEHGWHWYCVRLLESSAGGWRPSAAYDQPDNLRSFLNSVREVLTNDC
jgi:hypothetical protein